MPVGIELDNSFEKKITKAVTAIQEKDYVTAQEYIKSNVRELPRS